MANEDQEQKLSIPFDVQGVDDLDAAGDSLEKLRDALTGATSELKANQAALRALRGDSDEVTAARLALKAAIDAEKDAISSANLKLVQQGTSYEKLVAAQKAAIAETKRLNDEQNKAREKEKTELLKRHAEETKRLGESMRAAGGPAQGLRGRFDELKAALSTSTGAAFLAVAGVAALAAGVLAATGSVLHGVEALARWTIETANAQRAMALLRETVGGSVANGEALGTWVDQLARKLPLSTEKLNELASNITRTFNGTMVGGQGIVDTFQAVAAASAAMGDQAGNAIQGIIERGKQFGRGGVGLFELQGTGLQFDKLAAHVAKSMKLTMQQARMALAQGMVPIETLAADLRDTVNERFGGINAKKFLDLNSIAQRFQDRLGKLTKGFDLAPVLEGLEKLSNMFDESTVTGAALKTMLTVFGRLLGSTFKAGVPIAQQLFEQVILWSQRAMIAGLQLALVVKKMFDKPQGTGPGVLELLMAMPEQIARVTNPLMLLGAIFERLARGLDMGEKAVSWGENLVNGFIQGVKNAWNTATTTVKSFAQGVEDAFTSALRIRSPSKVFEDHGAQLPAGVAKGVDKGAPQASDAVGRMAPMPSGGGGRGGGVTIGDINVTVPAAPGSEAHAQAMGETIGRAIKAEILTYFEGLAANEGIPTQTAEAT